MRQSLANEIKRRFPETESLYHRLILVVGPSRSGKTAALQVLAQGLGVPLLNSNLLLSERIIGLPHQQRALRIGEILEELLGEQARPVNLLDNTELLFNPDLQQDPLRLLQSLSRRRVLVASWSGEWDGNALVYAEPGHPEYRKYSRPDAILIHSKTAG